MFDPRKPVQKSATPSAPSLPVAANAPTPITRALMSDSDRMVDAINRHSGIWEVAMQLRAEAEQFVTWTTHMGELEHTPRWGQTQKDHAARQRAAFRAKVAAIRESIAARVTEGMWPSSRTVEKLFDFVFESKVGVRTDSTVELLQAARAELGI